MNGMVALDEVQKRLIREVADLHEVPMGAYNFRVNSGLAGRNTTANIDIVSKPDGSGIDICFRQHFSHSFESVFIYFLRVMTYPSKIINYLLMRLIHSVYQRTFAIK